MGDLAYNFPSEADFRRGSMADGSPLKFISAGLEKEWPQAIPGKSLNASVARRQDVPPGCGDIFAPQPGAVPHSKVSCPVPEKTGSVDRAWRDSQAAMDAMAYKALAENTNFIAEVREISRLGMQVIRDHPEIVTEDLAPPPEDGASGKPRGERNHAPNFDVAKEKGNVEAMAAGLREALAQSQREAGAASPESSARDGAQAPLFDSGTNPDAARAPSAGGMARESHAGAKSFRVPQKYRAGIFARCMALIALGNRAASHYPKAMAEQLALGRKMLEHAKQSDLKDRFLDDRAHAVVKNTLLRLDREFTDLGFGAWMPFRYCDQWLMFTAAMRRVLAANGLITPKGPNHWRKFLEETPEAEEEKIEMPESISNQERFAAIDNVNELIEKAKRKAGLDPIYRKRLEERFGAGP